MPVCFNTKTNANVTFALFHTLVIRHISLLSLYSWLHPVSALCPLLHRPEMSWRPLHVLSYGGIEALLLSTGLPAHVLQVLQQCQHSRASTQLHLHPHHIDPSQCIRRSTHQHPQLWLHHQSTHQSCCHHHSSFYHWSLDHHSSSYLHHCWSSSFHPFPTKYYTNYPHSSIHQCPCPIHFLFHANHPSYYNLSQCNCSSPATACPRHRWQHNSTVTEHYK